MQKTPVKAGSSGYRLHSSGKEQEIKLEDLHRYIAVVQSVCKPNDNIISGS